MLRGGPPAIWRRDLEIGDEEQPAMFEGDDGVDFGWGVAPDGRVPFRPQFSRDLELCLGEVSDAAE